MLLGDTTLFASTKYSEVQNINIIRRLAVKFTFC